MKTFNRGTLRKLVEAGRVRVVGSYHFDDMTGASRDSAKGMPAAIAPTPGPDAWKQRKEGVCYIYPSDFTASCGRAWQNDNGTICLYVHSNSNFDLQILPEPAKAELTVEEIKARIAQLEHQLGKVDCCVSG